MPRGRPPAITRQLRAVAAAARWQIPTAPAPPRLARGTRLVVRTNTSSSLTSTSDPHPDLSTDASPSLPNVTTAQRAISADKALSPPNTEVSQRLSSPTASTSSVQPSPSAESISSAMNTYITQSKSSSETTQSTRPDPLTPPRSPSALEQVVTSVFAGVPSKLVRNYDGNAIYKNVGEVMPVGITMLLREVGDMDSRDIFMDIGSGFGNVVAQVVLATDIYRAIGVEIQESVQRAGIDAINGSPYAWALRERAVFVCKPVEDIRLSSDSPFAEATVVYWNNVLFQPPVVEHVKEQLRQMVDIRFLLSCVDLCPRHRPPCVFRFCYAFELLKVVDVPCSWKAVSQHVFIYKSKHNE
ncbi:Histone methylation protein DOT1 [Phytophthora infestans]|uniref:Histone-lysine N-methyltransferase, H3 lysine-79 specific n=1 Tax=Phytophthora infestans TaxID=4787 RepID=A0A833S7W2_PHYIN|nr:Histone methylation protein DOT1 [Phytophthora infestans]